MAGMGIREYDNRGQSGIELAVFFSFMMLLLIILSFEASERTRIIFQTKDALEADKVGDIAATNINIAASVGDGYTAKFFLPYGLTNSNYSIEIFKAEQRLDINYSQGYMKSFPLLTYNITGAPKQGENIVKNTKGEIILA